MMEYLYIVYLTISFAAAFGMTVFAVTFGYIMREALVETPLGTKRFDLSKAGLEPIHISILKLLYVICFLIMILFAAFAGVSV